MVRAMKPHEITSDGERMVHLAQTLAALGEEVREPGFDLVKALEEKDGARLAAWLSPGEIYNPGLRQLRKADAPDERTIQAYRKRLGSNLQAFMEIASSATGNNLYWVRRHVKWAARVSDRELDRLLDGRDHPAAVGQLCEALQLEYQDEWVLVDPKGLDDRIQHSMWASEVAAELQGQTTQQLTRLLSVLSKRKTTPARPNEYRAPRPGHRYRALYEALARDRRDVVRLTVPEVDELLREGGEKALPETARTKRAWWARSSSEAAAQPQTAAWTAAGYQVGKVETQQIAEGDPRIEAVEFTSLPGRREWLEDDARMEVGEYRLPGPGVVHIDLNALRDELPEQEAVRAEGGGREAPSPDGFDWEVNWLMGLVRSRGEANRAAIEKAAREKYGSDATDKWIANLLTRARRQGVIKNNGIKSRPRWVESGSKGDLMLFIAGQLGLLNETPPVEPGPEVPAEFVRMVADRLGVELAQDDPNEAIARAVIERLGAVWTETDNRKTIWFPAWLPKMRDAMVNHGSFGADAETRAGDDYSIT